jgi:peptidylprolyl isomerase
VANWTGVSYIKYREQYWTFPGGNVIILNMKGEKVKRFASVLMLMGLLASSVFMSGCSSDEGTAQEGDFVKVLYTGTLDDGTVFDSSELHGGEALNFTIGLGQMIPGFEQAVIGMSLNESKTVHIPADEAYGPYDEELVITFNWDQIEEGFVPVVGEQLYIQDASGQPVPVTVINVSEAGVTVDANPFLAGEDLTFEITLVEIVTPPTPTPIPTATPTSTTTPTLSPTPTPTPSATLNSS